MPSSLLFGINNEARVHTLSTTGSIWRELPYAGQEFKKLSAIPHFLWALGGDHQIYVYVHGLDIPIRVREEAYENERWIPIEGFSSRLLPTDRYHFSSADGTVDRSIDKIRLPSMAWQWEGDWQLELTLDGQPLDHNGWTYAIDFPAQYYPKKQWKSYVRRRLWVRSRKYSAMNSWCAIAPLHKDATQEPFIDISIGGQCVAGAEPGSMVVWAVTSHHRVMFRSGVSTKSPEGAKWIYISVPVGCEVGQLNVGPTGLLWASLLDGRALVRLGVTRDSLSGESWVEVRGPVDGSRILHISVGTSAVWAVTQDKQVWFRKGVKGEGSGVSEELAAGCGWVEMVGRMNMVSVAANDQVFAVGADDRLVYMRQGVNQADLTGKRWKALHAPLQVSRASSNASLHRDKFHNSFNALTRPSSMHDSSGISWDEQSHSAPTAPTSLPVGDLSAKYETQPKNPKAWSPVRSVGSVLGTEVHPDTDESVWSSRDSCIFAEDEELGWAECEASWSWVEAGACTVDTGQLPNWFAESGQTAQAELDQPWRMKILEELRARLPSSEEYANYLAAVDTTSWVHKGEARINLSDCFTDCVLQLEWVNISGTLTVLNPDGASTMHQINLNDIVCVQCSSEPGIPKLSLHTPHCTPKVVQLQFASDTVMEEWQLHLASTCNKIHKATEKPQNNSIWAVTNLGDIFVTDLTELEQSQKQKDKYLVEIDLAGKEVPYTIDLHGCCRPGTELTLNGCISDDADRIAINFEMLPTYKQKHKSTIELKNVCLHFNPRFSESVVVRNSMSDGSWVEEERSGDFPFKKGAEFVTTFYVTNTEFVIFVNEKKFVTFRHRFAPETITGLSIQGKLQPFKLKVESPEVIVNPRDLYWKQLGGHLRRVESCQIGVTWGIAYDHTCWVYTGGWGGAFYGPQDSHDIHPMTDSQDYRVYENQRWNPVSGYTSAVLPTDRYMWSDVTGRQKRNREQVKLLSMHWQWVSDWLVDFHVPGGVDREGWQYAVDFPANYHGHKHFTDMVRRRRWYRRCAVSTTGPWQELGHTKLLDVSMEVFRDDSESFVCVWALATGGQAMVRTGVTSASPLGSMWEHISSDQPLSSISCGPFGRVWATGKNGCAYYRTGITESKAEGEKWIFIEPPNNVQLKLVSCGPIGVWALDMVGKLYVRRDVTEIHPGGSHWFNVELTQAVTGASPKSTKFKHVSVGKREVWATTDSGVLLRRLGISQESPVGYSWDVGIEANWQHVYVGY